MPHTDSQSGLWRKVVWGGVALIAIGSLGGCSSTGPRKELALTGNYLVDGPNAIANGPPRDKVLWQYRTAAAAMRQGQWDTARRELDDAILTLQGIFGKDASARKARGYFNAEAKKTFMGEPYERSMAYVYRGILYWMEGQPDNARACFRSAQFEDSDTREQSYAGDWVLPDYLEGYATLKLGGDGADSFKRAQASAKEVKLPAYNPRANVLFFFEYGSGPIKYPAGQYGEQLHLRVPPPTVQSAEVKVDSFEFPVAPTDDVWFQASTRGGRVMDHILGNKAVFKSTTDTVGDVALIGGLSTAAFSHDSTTQQVGLGIAFAGLLSKAISAATTPQADTRSWDNLPRYLTFASLELSPGVHSVVVQFKNPSGQVVPAMTKTFSVEVPADRKDKVIFVSDQSVIPQKI